MATITSVSTDEGTYISGNVASLAATDGNYYATKSVAETDRAQSAIATITYNTSSLPASGGAVLWAYCAPVNGATLFAYFWNWSTGIYDFIQAFPLTAGSKFNPARIHFNSENPWFIEDSIYLFSGP